MTKASRWAWIVSAVAATGAGLVLAFLLSVATSNRSFYERHYVWLFWVNGVVAALLVLVIGIAAARLVVRLKRGKFGSRLLLKLAAIFALVGVLPGLLIYTVSYQFVSRSIESWFDVKVEGALDAGLNLGRGTLDAQVNDVAEKTRLAAERLGETPGDLQPLALERLREQLSASDVSIIGANGQLILTSGSAGSSAGTLLPERPSAALLRSARAGRVVGQLEGLDDDAGAAAAAAAAAAANPNPSAGGATDSGIAGRGGAGAAGSAAATTSNGTGGGPARVRALAYIPSASFDLAQQDRFLLVTQRVPTALAANALAVQSAYGEYQQRALARSGLRKMYIGTLTLTLILAVFGALLLAVTLSNQLLRPLLLLADGVRQVSQGDLSAKQVVTSRDELGGLTRSFADMTEQLAEARALVERSVAQVEGARTNLQTILDNLTAGVIVFDREGRIDTVNPGATRIVRLPLSAYRGRRLEEVPGFGEFAAAVRQRFELHEASPEAGERDQWQDAFNLQTHDAQGRDRDTLALLVRGAALPQGARLLVFDDISEVVSAQRSVAWGEVARRLAHEIKNPLTPIQLSAERLEHKLAAKLQGADQAMLVRSVGTIVDQVQAMKTLVNEFRDYARLPSAQMGPIDLNALVGDVLTLYANAQESGELAFDAAADAPPIIGDASQLRQVIHNLVQNALDAVTDSRQARVQVRTEAARTEHGVVRAVRLHVVDNGPGFAERVLKRAFEPYVTTKSKGTGLGLAVVKKIADEHGARIRLVNLSGDDAATPTGAQVSLSFSKLAPVGSHTPAAAVQTATTAAPAHWTFMATILVVDDELGIRALLSEILTDEGHTVELAENAAQARANRERMRPDLVLLDIWMPDVDGITLLKEWNTTAQLTMPVIMMSGHGTIDTAVEATRHGAMAFLEKPITLQKLLRAVEQGLAKPHTRLQAPAAGTPLNPADANLTVDSVMSGSPTLPTMAMSLGPQSEQSFNLDRPLREARDAFEKSYFEFHLSQENGSMTRVAEKTGLERTHLYRKLKQLGVDLSRNRRGM